MEARITIDLGNPQLLRQIRLEAARRDLLLREVVVEALESYLSHQQENQALLSLANAGFAEWDNPKDAAYDSL